MNKLDQLLNKNEIISNKLEKIKETYIKFYGEKYRDKIDESFNNLTIIPYMMPKAIKSNFFDISKDISNELKKSFLNMINFEATEDNIKLFFENASFEYLNIIPIARVYKLIEKRETDNLSNYEKTQLFENLSNILKVEVNENNLENAIENIMKYKLSFDEIILRYNDTMTKYRDLQKENQIYNENVNKLEKEYTLVFFQMIKDYLSLKDKTYIESVKNNPRNFYISDLECKDIFCNYTFYNQGLIDFFSKESDIILNDSETSSWRIDEIKNSRIKYFKLQGLDLGSDYENYMNHPEIKNYYPSSLLTSTVSKVKTELKKRLAKENFKLTPVYKEYFDYLSNMNLKTLDGFTEKLLFYTKEVNYELFDNITIGTYVVPSVTNDNRLHSLLVYDLNLEERYLDQILLHELNHIVESNLVDITEEKGIVKTGFDYLDVDFKSDEYEDETRRDFEYLNEVINELLMQDMHIMMNQEELYIFNTKENTKVTGLTSYEHVKSFIKDFYISYKEDLKEARLSSDITNLFNKVGKENLIDLNNLIVKFFDNFDGMVYYSLIRDLRDKKETERTILYNELLEESKNIFSRMQSYQLEKANIK